MTATAMHDLPRVGERDLDEALAAWQAAPAPGIRNVAEGVETREQLDFLRRQGCDTMQGYYFSRPVPADDIARLLRNGRRPAAAERSGDMAT